MSRRPDGPARVVVRRRLPADPDTVFDHFADADMLGRWFYAGAATSCRATCEFEVGGRYRLVMFEPNGETSEHGGRYIEIDRPKRLRFTWSHGEGLDSVVTFDFRRIGAETDLTVTHAEIPPDMSELFQNGWVQCLGYLARLFLGS